MQDVDERRAVTPDRIFLAGVLLVASLLLFTRLDDRFLWQDEAETALLAQSVLVHGVPTAVDGDRVISQEGGAEFSPDDPRWFWTPWLQHYATAASFALLGPSTFSARLPFVLFALGALGLTWALAREIDPGAWTAHASVVLLTTNVPFLLHARQCRYYAPAAFFALLLVWQYLRALDGRRGAMAWLGLAAVGLFHSHYVVCAGLGLGLALHFALFERRRERLLGFAATAAVASPFVAPWLFEFLARGSGQAFPGLARSLASFGEALFHLNRYAMPLLVPIAASVTWIAGRRARDVATPDAPTRRGRLALGLAATTCLLLLVVVMPWFFFRYYVPLLPLAAIGVALCVAPLLRARRGVGVAVVAVLATTDVVARMLPIPHDVPANSTRHFRTGDEEPGRVVGTWARFSPLAAYLHEITRDHEGPIEALVRRLEGEVEAGQTMLATYGDLSVRFYLPALHVVGGLSGQDPGPYVDADWLFVRAHTHRSGDARLKRFISTHVDVQAYERIPLGVADVPYENRPDPTYHKYRMPRIGDAGLLEARVWRRRPSGSPAD